MLLTLIISYYDSPETFKRQVETWNSYPECIKKELEIIVVDDCSHDVPLSSVLVFQKGLNMRVFRIKKKAMWNSISCRNIGAKEAKGKWLLFTDIDHLLPREQAIELFEILNEKEDNKLNLLLSPRMAYNLSRIDEQGEIMDMHNFSFLMTKKLFWEIGGYDEEFAGAWDNKKHYIKRIDNFLGQSIACVPIQLMKIESEKCDLPKDIDRDRRIKIYVNNRKRFYQREDSVITLTFPYEEIKIDSIGKYVYEV